VLLVPLCGATIEGMHIGIIGAGDLGIALGERLASRRHQVMFGGGESARKVATRGGAKAGINAAVDRALADAGPLTNPVARRSTRPTGRIPMRPRSGWSGE